MNARQQKIGVIILFLIIIGAFLEWPSGPSYQGRSIKKWFYGVGNINSHSDQDKVGEAFRAMGPQAIPFLIRRLETPPSRRIKGWLSAVSSQDAEGYRQNMEMWQSRAAYVLGEMGPAAKSAESNLMTAAESPNWSLRGAATVALVKIRQQSLEPWIEKLKDTSDWQAWYENAMIVGQFGPRAEPAIPILLQSLHHTNNIIQAHALIALGMIGSQPDRCIPAILPFLSSVNVSDRQKALFSLINFGTNAIIAKPAIKNALTDSDPWVRREAQMALKIFDGMAETESGASSKPK